MSQVKKISALLLVFVITSLTLSGCGENRKNKDDGFSFDPPPEIETEIDPDSYGGFNYEITEDGTITITGYESIARNAIIPESINGHPVTKIAPGTCFENTVLQSLEMPDTITVIGDKAFHGCTSLTDIKISKNLAEVGGRAFDHTPFIENITEEFFIVGDGILLRYNGASTDVTVPDGVKYISSAFNGNALVRSVVLPETVITIGSDAFASCISLSDVEIPHGVTTIGDRAFSKCVSLAEIKMPDSVVSIGEQCYLYCSSAKSIYVSSGITSIPEKAFQYCSGITSVVIPASVTSIGAQAFQHCNGLTDVTITAKFTEIGEYAFAECQNQLTVTCPEGSMAEEYCHLNGISFIN